jgi:putative intracellular protease/amidase
MVLFPAFQSIDVFGPLDVLNTLALQRPLHISLLSSTLEPVSTKPTVMNVSGSNSGESIVPTHTFNVPPEDLEVLFVPGRIETRGEAFVALVVEFVREMYPKLRYLVSVYTGATIVAKPGVLDGRRATTNKRSWSWVSG